MMALKNHPEFKKQEINKIFLASPIYKRILPIGWLVIKLFLLKLLLVMDK